MRSQHDRYVVTGGSVAGLASALALARAGREVTIVERDLFAEALDPEQAFASERPGVPQAHFLHAFLARMVVTLRDRFPDVLAALEEAGARVDPMGEGVDLGDGLGLLIVRRSTLEWVLRRVVMAEPGVEVRSGRTVVGLEATTGSNGSPTVTGVLLDDGTALTGTVVACTGRRGDLNKWLQPFGVSIPERLVESELVYVTRWYAVDRSVAVTPTLGDLGYLSYLSLPCDAGTLAVAVAVDPSDSQLRSCLLDNEGFDRLVGQLPRVGDALAATAARPIRSSRPMAGLVNRLRSFLDDDARPRVLGLHAVGDAHTITNPAYGRGCSLAVVQAALLADAVTAHADDPQATATAYETACTREVEPWFHNSGLMDTMRLHRRKQADRSGGDEPGLDLSRFFGALAWGVVEDPVVASGFGRMMNLLITPEELFADGDFVSRLGRLASTPASTPARGAAAPSGPSREELLRAATGAAA